jgi:DNA-binding CsgD family transcriptional regulator
LRADAHAEETWSTLWLHELIEAAARAGDGARAAEALEQLSAMTRVSGSDWALGLAARSRALVQGEEADYREAIERLGRTRLRAQLARAHLIYGEWLRRERRRVDAREQLRIAHRELAGMGLDGFAERARRELLATGETARRGRARAAGRLTAHEAQVARLASEGLSNAEIAARLFISPRTVQHHLRKVFAQLEIESRDQLAGALAGEAGRT